MSNKHTSVNKLIPTIRPRIVVDSCVWISATDQLILFSLDSQRCLQLISSLDIYNEINKNMINKFKNKKSPSTDPKESARRAMEELTQHSSIECNKTYDKNLRLGFEFPAKDVHVVALAIATVARTILTSDKHFLNSKSRSNLKNYHGITAVKPDDFYSDILLQNQFAAMLAFKQMKTDMSLSVDQFIERIENHKLSKTASKLKRHKNLL